MSKQPNIPYRDLFESNKIIKKKFFEIFQKNIALKEYFNWWKQLKRFLNSLDNAVGHSW